MYAHTPNLLQQSRLPVFDNPEGFENRLLFLFRCGFHISVQKMGNCNCISTCLRAARYKYLPILKRKIWDKMPSRQLLSRRAVCPSQAGTEGREFRSVVRARMSFSLKDPFLKALIHLRRINHPPKRTRSLRQERYH